jgi:hypothetical protein
MKDTTRANAAFSATVVAAGAVRTGGEARADAKQAYGEGASLQVGDRW